MKKKLILKFQNYSDQNFSWEKRQILKIIEHQVNPKLLDAFEYHRNRRFSLKKSAIIS